MFSCRISSLSALALAFLGLVGCGKRAGSEKLASPSPPSALTPPSAASTTFHPSPSAAAILSKLSDPIPVVKQELAELKPDDMSKFEAVLEKGDFSSDFFKRTYRLTENLDVLTQTNELSDDELRKIARYVRHGPFAYAAVRAMQRINERQSIMGWSADAIKNYFGPPTMETKERIDYVIDDGLSVYSVVFWMEDGIVVKMWP